MRLNIQDNNKNNIFSTILKQLKSFTSDITINCYKNNLYIQFLDNNHICLCEVSLSKKWFDIYNVNEEEILGLNTEILQKIIKCKNENDNILIEYHNNDDNLHIMFNNIDIDNSITKSFEVPLIELNSELINPSNNNENQADIKFESSSFFNLINELSMFSNRLDIDINEDEINMTSNGDSGKYTINVDIDKVEEFSIDEGAIITQSFNIRYFTLISTLSKICEYVNISVGEDSPMIILFNLDNKKEKDNKEEGEGEEEEEEEEEEEGEEECEPINFVRFFLAPIIV
jgi:proliferating cell nuclear antigen PCNA